MKLRLVSDRFFSPKTETGRLLISTPTLMECNSVVECCADNAEVVSSNLTIPIPLYEEILREISSAVVASALQAECHWFDSSISHWEYSQTWYIE